MVFILFELIAPIGDRLVRSMIPTDWLSDFFQAKDKVLEEIEEHEERYFQKMSLDKKVEDEKRQAYFNNIQKDLRALRKNIGTRVHHA